MTIQSDTTNDLPPKLQPPGAGLPPLELFTAKHFLFPAFCRLHDFSKATAHFEITANKLIQATEASPQPLREKPVLVKPLQGIEDSSRYWSSSMVLEHLIIVGNLMADVIEHLAFDKEVPFVADVAAVKPTGQLSGELCILQYRDFTHKFLLKVKPLRELEHKPNTYNHPWFGPINLHQWLCLAGLHEQIHLKQIDEIAKSLTKNRANR
ncbi:MAG: hypothetical protein IPJ49_01130 [Candidatus Obscuribacter sp.]|nr:hypothetical protein [Candidatus Obscuribacter sp.]